MIDEKRRAINAYTEECSTRPQDLGIYSTPYGQYNKSKTSRPLIAYEVASRDRMSGGGAINTKHELVGIIRGTQFPEQLSWKQHLYNRLVYVINCVPHTITACCWTVPFFETCPPTSGSGTRTRSTPIAPLKDWIESVQRQYGEDSHMV